MIRQEITPPPLDIASFTYDKDNPTKYTEALSFQLMTLLSSARTSGAVIEFTDTGTFEEAFNSWAETLQTTAANTIDFMLSYGDGNLIETPLQPLNAPEGCQTIPESIKVLHSCLDALNNAIPTVCLWFMEKEKTRRAETFDSNGKPYRDSQGFRGVSKEFIDSFAQDVKALISAVNAPESTPKTSQEAFSFIAEFGLSTPDPILDNPFVTKLLHLLVDLAYFFWLKLWEKIGEEIGKLAETESNPLLKILTTALLSKDGENSLLHLLQRIPLKIFLDKQDVYTESIPDFE